MRCVYKVDSLRCTLEFAHLGWHEAVIPGRQDLMRWHYDKTLRRADEERGAPMCESQWVEPDSVEEVRRCRGPLGHPGHHTDRDVVWTDEQIEAILNPPPEPEPEPAKPEPVIKAHVQDALAMREGMDAVTVAMRTASGEVIRYEAIRHQVHSSGALMIDTVDADITYAPHAWHSITAEPTVY